MSRRHEPLFSPVVLPLWRRAVPAKNANTMVLWYRLRQPAPLRVLLLLAVPICPKRFHSRLGATGSL